MLIVLGALAYLVTLIVTLPARTALAWSHAPMAWQAGATGTAWNGAADLGAGVSIRWKFAPFRSLGALSPVAEVSVQGPKTSLSGRTRKVRGGVRIERLSGEAAWPLIAALAPRLTFACDLSMQIDMRQMTISDRGSNAAGRAIIPPGVCRSRVDPLAAPKATPPLMATAAGNTLVIAPQARPGEALLRADLPDGGGLKLAVTTAGAALLPDAAAGPMSLEIRP